MMKKRLPFAFRLFMLFFAFTGTIQAQTSVRIQAGANLSKMKIVSEAGEETGTEAIPRFQIGLAVDIPMFSDFYLQPSVRYVGKGYKQDGGWLAAPDKEFKATVNYVEVPVNFLYKSRLGFGNLLLGAGPYAGYGTGGQWQADQGQIIIGDIAIEPKGDAVFKSDVNNGEFGKYLYGKPWDYGVSLLAGYEFFHRLSIQFDVKLGVANLQPDLNGSASDGKLKNIGYGLSIGYCL